MIAILWQFRRPIGYALAAIAIIGLAWWRIEAYGDAREKAGKDEVQALWDADVAARDKATADAIAAQKAREEAQRASNEVTIRDYTQKLLAIAADRDSLSRRLHDYQDRLRSLAAAQAGGASGTADPGPVASSPTEADRRTDELDAACRADAEQLNALIQVVREQM